MTDVCKNDFCREEHFGKFDSRKKYYVSQEVLGGFFSQKEHEFRNFFRTSCEKDLAGLLKTIRYLRVRITNLDRIGTLKTSKQFPGNQKLAFYVFMRRFPSTPE